MYIIQIQAGDSHCGADAYFDGVQGECVPCGDICHGEIKTEFCTINCPGIALGVFILLGRNIGSRTNAQQKSEMNAFYEFIS